MNYILIIFIFGLCAVSFYASDSIKSLRGNPINNTLHTSFLTSNDIINNHAIKEQMIHDRMKYFKSAELYNHYEHKKTSDPILSISSHSSYYSLMNSTSYHISNHSIHYMNALNALKPWYYGHKPWHNKPFSNIRVSTKDIMDGFPFLFKNDRTGQKAIICLIEKTGSSAWKSLLIKHLDPDCFQRVRLSLYIFIIWNVSYSSS